MCLWAVYKWNHRTSLSQICHHQGISHSPSGQMVSQSDLRSPLVADSSTPSPAVQGTHGLAWARVKCILYTVGYIILDRNAHLYFDVKLKYHYLFFLQWNVCSYAVERGGIAVWHVCVPPLDAAVSKMYLSITCSAIIFSSLTVLCVAVPKGLCDYADV